MQQEMYCLKCKSKKNVNVELIAKDTIKGVKYMFYSECPDCKTKMCKMTKNPNDNSIKIEVPKINIMVENQKKN